MEALEPGKPLTFLDHHIQCGNSLLGCTPALLKKGIPDAAFTPLTGDDKAYCSTFKKLNKEESKGNIDIFSSERDDWLIKRKLQPGISALNDIADDNLAGLNAKERSYTDFVQSQDYQNTKLIYDAWCAAFVWIKDGDSQRPEPITYGIMESIKSDPENIDLSLRQEIMRLADEYKFFHWHIAFPDVFPL
ncbi:MAG: SAM-dependent DNA methyltransferase, partial [Candidatus Cloacimonetes bacterium]|nr:SAM-dependent DNA methyltransferase [Candidatus Cloacimonadota bacterium]